MKTPDPLFDAVESFFVDYLKLLRGSSQTTLESYRDTLRLFFEYVSSVRKTSIDRLHLTDLDADLVGAFLQHLERDRHNQVSTRNCRLAALHSFFAHVLRRHPEHAGRLARIIALPSKRHPPAPPRYLDPPVIQLLLRGPNRETTAGRRDYALILFLYNTGARVSEAIAVHHKDLLPGPAVHLIGKGRKERVCPLWPETAAALKAQVHRASIDPEESLFKNARGKALSRHGIYYILRQQAAAVHQVDASVPTKISPHLMRHSCAVALLQAGVDLVTIRDQLGHVSIATTGRYATSNLKLKRAALEAFWTATGMTSPRGKKWRPSPTLLSFLHSI
jgi:site-specific recombinase XerD